MVGDPGQTIKHLIQDILFIEQLRPEMIGIGPFLPHTWKRALPVSQRNRGTDTPLLSIFRLMHPSALISGNYGSDTCISGCRLDNGGARF